MTTGGRQPKRGGRGPRPSVFGVVAALAGIGLVAGYLRLPVRMQNVRVTGSTRLAREEVVRMIGMEPGTLMGPAEARQVEMNLSRRPPFASVSVSRGLTGILHVKVVEREPVAWDAARGCAVARDGVLLPFLTLREADWIGLEGLPVSQGRITSPGLVTEALTIRGALAAAGADLRGTLRHAGAAGWEWVAGGKRLALSSPPQPGELTRLARFQRGFPEAWAKARALDLRYADRVVVSR